MSLNQETFNATNLDEQMLYLRLPWLAWIEAHYIQNMCRLSSSMGRLRDMDFPDAIYCKFILAFHMFWARCDMKYSS